MSKRVGRNKINILSTTPSTYLSSIYLFPYTYSVCGARTTVEGNGPDFKNLDKAVCISLNVNTFGKDMNATILSPARAK